jgi:hypothetical protein
MLFGVPDLTGAAVDSSTSADAIIRIQLAILVLLFNLGCLLKNQRRTAARL